MIRVLIVDDSQVSRTQLTRILENEADITVVGTAKEGTEALSLSGKLQPDIITMDINMPGMDGFETTRQIMEQYPVPIIIISGVENINEIAASFKVMEAGALSVLQKPPSPHHPDFEKYCKEIITAIRTFVEVKVIKRKKTSILKTKGSNSFQLFLKYKPALIAIGASTGGPPVIQTILRGLTPSLPIPLILVQHMSPGFIGGFAEWLSDSTGFKVKVPGNMEIMKPGILYVAPDSFQTGVTRDFRVFLSNSPPEHNLKPSVSFLFRSVAENIGASAIGILLTGMGEDGAEDLLNLHNCGAITIVQDRESSIVYGMPGTALKLGAASFILNPEEIAQEISLLSKMV